jgi:integration host factor subunit beta
MAVRPARAAGEGTVTKKEIVKQISESIDETQLKTKEIVQQTFDAIVDTLIRDGRIELRNFGVFEVKRRKARKARNPRTGQKVDVPPKNVVTFKPGKKMEELVSQMTNVTDMNDEDEDAVPVEAGAVANGLDDRSEGSRSKPGRGRKTP